MKNYSGIGPFDFAGKLVEVPMTFGQSGFVLK